MIQARKNRNLKKHEAIEKTLLQRQGKKLKRPHSLKKYQTPESFDTDSDGEQKLQPKKVSKTTEYSDDEQEPTVKCIVMYSTEDEQKPVVKKLQKADEDPQETS